MTNRFQKHVICALIWLLTLWFMAWLVALPIDWRIGLTCWVGMVVDDVAKSVAGLDKRESDGAH